MNQGPAVTSLWSWCPLLRGSNPKSCRIVSMQTLATIVNWEPFASKLGRRSRLLVMVQVQEMCHDVPQESNDMPIVFNINLLNQVFLIGFCISKCLSAGIESNFCHQSSFASDTCEPLWAEHLSPPRKRASSIRVSGPSQRILMFWIFGRTENQISFFIADPKREFWCSPTFGQVDGGMVWPFWHG